MKQLKQIGIIALFLLVPISSHGKLVEWQISGEIKKITTRLHHPEKKRVRITTNSKETTVTGFPEHDTDEIYTYDASVEEPLTNYKIELSAPSSSFHPSRSPLISYTKDIEKNIGMVTFDDEKFKIEVTKLKGNLNELDITPFKIVRTHEQ